MQNWLVHFVCLFLLTLNIYSRSHDGGFIMLNTFDDCSWQCALFCAFHVVWISLFFCAYSDTCLPRVVNWRSIFWDSFTGPDHRFGPSRNGIPYTFRLGLVHWSRSPIRTLHMILCTSGIRFRAWSSTPFRKSSIFFSRVHKSEMQHLVLHQTYFKVLMRAIVEHKD